MTQFAGEFVRPIGNRLELIAVDGLPEVTPDDDLPAMIIRAMATTGDTLADQDIVVVAQKVVSKAEDRLVRLDEVEPDETACRIGHQTLKDPRLVYLIMQESSRIVRSRENLLITQHRSGHIMANAGIDQSNVAGCAGNTVTLLPSDADASAQALRDRLRELSGVRVGVIVSDSFGRPWRLGTCGTAIGVAGPPALTDHRGRPDRAGRELLVTEIGVADEIAAAASLLMGQADEGRPVVVVRGLGWNDSKQAASDLIRPADQDLFR